MPRISDVRRARMVKALDSDREEVEKWTDRLGSTSTRDVWPRRLAAFCIAVGKTPGDLVRLASEVNERGQKTALRDLFAAYEKRERGRGNKGSTVAYTVKVVKSWLGFNGVDVPRGLVKVHGADDVYSEAALSRDELRSVIHAATRRERAAIALMAFSGLRPMVLGGYDGSEGLRIRDLIDLKIDSKSRSASFVRVPARILVRQELSKGKHVYSTFLGTEGCEYLVEYLNSRLRPAADWKKGENVRPESPVIIPERADRDFITTTNIGDTIRKAIRRAGLTARPYALRTTFATRLLSAEAESQLPHSLAQFWMGHSGDMTARYAQNRGQLPPEVIEQMREAYRRCEPYLSTAPVASSADRDNRSVSLLLRLAGVTEAELAKIDLEKVSDEELIALADSKRAGAQAAPARAGQRAVPIAEAGSMLEAGWEYVAALGSDLVVLRSPCLPQSE